MKAEEPGSRQKAEKYGLPASESHHIVRRHFEVLDEDAAFQGGALAYDIERSHALRAALDVAKRPSATVAPPAPSLATPPMPAPAVVSQRARPDNLRERLGLS